MFLGVKIAKKKKVNHKIVAQCLLMGYFMKLIPNLQM